MFSFHNQYINYFQNKIVHVIYMLSSLLVSGEILLINLTINIYTLIIFRL